MLSAEKGRLGKGWSQAAAGGSHDSLGDGGDGLNRGGWVRVREKTSRRCGRFRKSTWGRGLAQPASSIGAVGLLSIQPR
jgi:hypothetical protein